MYISIWPPVTDNLLYQSSGRPLFGACPPFQNAQLDPAGREGAETAGNEAAIGLATTARNCVTRYPANRSKEKDGDCWGVGT